MIYGPNTWVSSKNKGDLLQPSCGAACLAMQWSLDSASWTEFQGITNQCQPPIIIPNIIPLRSMIHGLRQPAANDSSVPSLCVERDLGCPCPSGFYLSSTQGLTCYDLSEIYRKALDQDGVKIIDIVMYTAFVCICSITFGQIACEYVSCSSFVLGLLCFCKSN